MSLLNEALDDGKKKWPQDPAESKPRKEKTAKPSGGIDLFVWLDALWTKARLDEQGTPPMYVMHRFLASEVDFADAARWLQLQVREPLLVFRTWQGLLPKGRGAPRLQYAAPKKPPKEEALVARMMQVLSERRTSVEEMVAMVKTAGREADLYAEYGMEAPSE